MKSVLFDPGYASCLIGISDSVEFVYNAFLTSNLPLKQKKFQFSILAPKLKAMLKRNVSFYLGCLLWASYIKTLKGALIENNPCLNGEYNEESSLEEIKFLIDFENEKFNRDMKYYMNSKHEKNDKYIKILEGYMEFIKLNKGFVSVKTTDELVLPDCLKALGDSCSNKVKEKIDEAINKKDLTLLFDVYDLILD